MSIPIPMPPTAWVKELKVGCLRKYFSALLIIFTQRVEEMGFFVKGALWCTILEVIFQFIVE